MEKFIKRVAIAILTGILAFAVIPATVQAAGWKQNKNGYWWQENDYSYPRNQWKTIYGKQYHFNSSGYMDTGWKQIDGKWYYLGSKNDGVKKTYWQKVYGKYYWLGNDGAMRTGWQKVYNKYYWLGSSNDGAMKTGWQKVYGKYYWLGHSNDGAMKTGWQTVYGKKYYLGGANDGAMKTGWQKIEGYDYYFGKTGESNEGVLRTNTWVGNYYVDANGRWDKSKTVEISDYLINGKDAQMIKDLGLKYTRKASDSEIKYYEKDKINYAVGTDYSGKAGFEFTNRGATYLTLYGIKPGQSKSEAVNTWKRQGWKIFTDDGDEILLKEINGKVYEINFFPDVYGRITGWRLRNWLVESMPNALFSSDDNTSMEMKEQEEMEDESARESLKESEIEAPAVEENAMQNGEIDIKEIEKQENNETDTVSNE